MHDESEDEMTDDENASPHPLDNGALPQRRVNLEKAWSTITDDEPGAVPAHQTVTDLESESSSRRGTGSSSAVAPALEESVMSAAGPEGSAEAPEEFWDTDSEDEDEEPTVCACFRNPLFWLINQRFFDISVNMLILVNTLLLCSVYDGMSTAHENFLWYAEFGFMIVFAIEAVIKMLALGVWPGYFRHGSNIFDFFLVVCSVVATIVDSGLLAVLRISRVLRIFRLLRGSRYYILFAVTGLTRCDVV